MTDDGARGGRGGEVRRAARLSADTYIAPYITRRGRFAARNPLVGKPLPSLLNVLGVAGWGALTGYAFWRARRDQPGPADFDS